MFVPIVTFMKMTKRELSKLIKESVRKSLSEQVDESDYQEYKELYEDLTRVQYHLNRLMHDDSVNVESAHKEIISKMKRALDLFVDFDNHRNLPF